MVFPVPMRRIAVLLAALTALASLPTTALAGLPDPCTYDAGTKTVAASPTGLPGRLVDPERRRDLARRRRVQRGGHVEHRHDRDHGIRVLGRRAGPDRRAVRAGGDRRGRRWIPRSRSSDHGRDRRTSSSPGPTVPTRSISTSAERSSTGSKVSSIWTRLNRLMTPTSPSTASTSSPRRSSSAKAATRSRPVATDPGRSTASSTACSSSRAAQAPTSSSPALGTGAATGEMRRRA